MDFNPQFLLLKIPALLLGLTIHECAHAWVALLRGDNTAQRAGRLTLNPFAHLDIFGTLMILLGPFGWAKPVPVDGRFLKGGRRDMVWVALAGPGSNILLAIVTALVYKAVSSWGFAGSVNGGYITSFLQVLFLINIGLSFFNLLPIPPLDGSNIVLGLLPQHRLDGYIRVMQHAPTVLFALLTLEWMTHIRLFSAIINPLWNPYYNFWTALLF
jgi:Zn-dependent protease